MQLLRGQVRYRDANLTARVQVTGPSLTLAGKSDAKLLVEVVLRDLLQTSARVLARVSAARLLLQ